MDLLAALAAGHAPADATLDGYPLGWLRVPLSWDTGIRRLDEHLLYLIASGSITVETGDSILEAGAGCAVLIPPHSTFRATAGGTPPAFWRVRLRLPQPWDGPIAIAHAQDLEPVVSRLVSEAAGTAPHRDAAIRGLLLVLLASLRRLSASSRAQRLTAAQCALLERHADAHPEATPRDLARRLGLTLDYATRLVRATFGRPPRRWLLERRMHAAAVRVAEGDEPIARIAEDLGYADPRLFGRQFRQVLGAPPGRFRARVRTA